MKVFISVLLVLWIIIRCVLVLVSDIGFLVVGINVCSMGYFCGLVFLIVLGWGLISLLRCSVLMWVVLILII